MIKTFINQKRYYFILVLCILFAAGGCRTEDLTETEKKVLEKDPHFRKVLDKRNDIREKTDTETALFLEKKKKVQDEIKVLEEEKQRLESEYKLTARVLKKQLQPEKDQLRCELLEKKQEYNEKQRNIRNISSDINEIDKLLKKKGALELSKEEIRSWNERLSALVSQKKDAEFEKDKIKKEMEIFKGKLKLIN
ncbi:MAG: hypothetical protein ABH869_05015 [Candidatus Omnitrophota bacterium]